MDNSESSWLEVPEHLHGKVNIDIAKMVVNVATQTSYDPIFLTWLERNKTIGFDFFVETSSLEDLKETQNYKRADTDLDLKVRSRALDIITTAAKHGASDVHIMLRAGFCDIQLCVKGGLRSLEQVDVLEGESIIRAIYQGLAETRDASYQPLDFQNAQIPGHVFPSNSGISSVRVVRGPCYPQPAGSFLTLRIQYFGSHLEQNELVQLRPLFYPRRPERSQRFFEMGFSADQIEKIKLMMDMPNGLIVFTGSTGSGKTTTMFEVLQELARTKPWRRQVTIEDPVEYPMPWAVQMAVTDAKDDETTGKAFGDRVRVSLRMAPHIILLGELRGPEVALAALEAALTGHQVWTTMHVNDPFAFVDRFEIMDNARLNRKVFCDHKVLRAIVAQRVVPRLCDACSIRMIDSANFPERIMNNLCTWGGIGNVRITGNGCDACNGDGTTGRFAVAEIILLDFELMQDFVNYGSDVARKNYRSRPNAEMPMLERAINHVLEGRLDPLRIEELIDLIPKKGEVT